MQSEKNEFLGGGYCASREDAQNDVTIWLKGKRVDVSCNVHWVDDNDVERITPGPCSGVISAVDFRSDASVLDIHIDQGGCFLYEREADGDVLALRDVSPCVKK